MSGTYFGLIPTAVLLENPGQTLEELTNTFGNLNFNLVPRDILEQNKLRKEELISEEDIGCDYKMHIDDALKLNQGIFGTINILNIEQIEELPPQYRNDEEHIAGLKVIPYHNGNRWCKPKYQLIAYQGKESGTSIGIKKMYQKSELNIGDIISRESLREELPSQRIIVTKGRITKELKRLKIVTIFETKHKEYQIAKIISRKKRNLREFGAPHDEDIFEYQLALNTFCPKYEVQEFRNLNDLIRRNPWADPERLFNLKQTSGEISVLGDRPPIIKDELRNAKVQWLKKDGKYYLDREHLLRYNLENIYSWTILTAEALKTKSYDMVWGGNGDEYFLSYHKFLLDNPTSHERHLKEISNWWLHRYAYTHENSTNELFRMRLDRHPIDLEFERRHHLQEYKKYLKIVTEQRKTRLKQ